MRLPLQRRRARAHDPCGDRPIETVVDAHDRLIDSALHSTVDRHRTGADEAVVLTETLIAVRAAQAIEKLTGVAWDRTLESRATDIRERSEEAP